MSLENPTIPSEEAPLHPSPARIRPIQTHIKSALLLTLFLDISGCASDFQQTSAPTMKTYSICPDLPLPINDPALVTMEEIAAISSDRVPPSRLEGMMDQIEMTDGNLRIQRILIAREALKNPQSPRTLQSLCEEKLRLEQAAQQVTAQFLREASVDISSSQLRYPESFDMKSVLDAEESLQDDVGRRNTFLIHRMKDEETKLRHLRLMIALCRSDRNLRDPEKSFLLQQLTVTVRMTEDALQLLQNLFQKRM